MTGTSGGVAAAEPAFPLQEEEIDSFASRSPALGDILHAADIKRLVTGYEREDQRATKGRGRFSRVATHLNVSVLTTAIVGALILALGLLQAPLQMLDAGFEQPIRWTLAALGFMGLLISGYGAARLYELNAGDLAGDWMRSRARAEQLRSEYFERVVSRAVAADAVAQSATFDLVIAHLLEHQLGYFARRGLRHEVAAAKCLRWAAFASGVASVGVAAGGMAGAMGGMQPWILAAAVFGGIGGAVAAFAAAQEAIGQERERAQRFRNNVDALELLARQIGDVRAAIASGTSETLVTFTGALNQQLALELGRFLQGGESIRASIAKLSEQIEKSQREDQKGAPQTS